VRAVAAAAQLRLVFRGLLGDLSLTTVGGQGVAGDRRREVVRWGGEAAGAPPRPRVAGGRCRRDRDVEEEEVES
jgi:hypothetical protein